ncbi:T9SS type B sorting domain-containing protein [Parapedobacter koreensis]|uniref:Gliding motility-associated C-terminal domain-containing protein n=1 Tax=Parapedobacter koreensis TaxID=332977 RepID=A0A1H7TIW3_9SPHI|nr:gliding motility-associated C-terminal domain-containing protein [Parapedobacter koreensis]SEL84760.1 gliding motility-associated C-terminal domain-containing protein [Parapedobacter koreensis]
MKHRYLITCFLLFGILNAGATMLVPPAIRYIKTMENGGGTGADGLTWATANSDLQAMIDELEALGGGEIWVAEGTYIAPGAMFEAGGFVMKNNVAIYGGFTGTEASFDERDWKNNETILSGNGEKIVINNSFSEEAPLLATAILDGFIITKGYSEYPVYHGGGIYNSHASPTLNNLIIKDNAAFSNGGGIANYSGSSPVLTAVVVSGNTAYFGGGIMCDDSSPQLINVVISGNDAESFGGGLYLVNSSPTFINVTIAGNAAPYMTGGGGLYTDGSSLPKIFNSLIWGNSDDWLHYTPQVDAVSSDNLIERLPGHNQINGEEYMGDGASLFVDYQPAAAYTPVLGGDYRLKASSPAIDLGNNEHYPGALETAVDAAGNPRVYQLAEGGIIDLGAYESMEERVEEPTVATVYYVKPGGTGDGSDWGNASGDLQAMIDAARVGNQVWVAAGTYRAPGTGDEGGFTLKNDVAVYGGFVGDENSLDERDWRTNVTILSGGNESPVVNNDYYVSDPLTVTAILDGFTLTEGNNTGSWGGGGIHNSYASPTLTNLLISGNAADAMGGGIANHFSSSPTLTNVVISGNEAALGGGMYNNDNSSPTLTNVVISGNVAIVEGGGLANDMGSIPVLTNVTISGNIADNRGIGGIINFGSSSIELYNSIVWGNGSNNFRGTISGASSHNLIEGLNGHNTINGTRFTGRVADLFVNPVAATVGGAVAGGDYRLHGCALVIEAGDNTKYPGGLEGLSTAVDLAGNARLQHSAIDLGAYEFQDIPSPRMIYPEGKNYRADDELVFTVRFFKPITVTGTSYITLTIGDDERQALYAGTAEDGQDVLFSYVIQDEDVDSDGLVDDGMISIADGNISYQDGGDAVQLAYCGELATDIVVNRTGPVLTHVSIASDNEIPAWAKVGDKVTITFMANKPIERPAVSVGGNTADVEAVGSDGLQWEAAYVFQVADPEGTIGFTISGIVDLLGDEAPDVTGTTDESSVQFDKTPPGVTGVSDGGIYRTDVTPLFEENTTATLNGEPYERGEAIVAEGDHTLLVVDAAGNETAVTFSIDKTRPVVLGVQDGGSYNADVMISFNEGVATLNDEPYHWGDAISDEGEYRLVVTDVAGNEETIRFVIDKTAPVVTEVEDGEIYDSAVTPVFNEGEAKLNGIPYASGTQITVGGAYDLIVTDAAGNETSLSFTIGGLPGIPAGLSAIAGDKRVDLSWEAPAEGFPSVTDYIIEYSDDDGQTWTRVDHAASAATNAVVIDLFNDRTYTFRVAAINAMGTGSFSGILGGVTPRGANSGPAGRWPQAISFRELADVTYGDGPVELWAAISSGLPVTYTVTTVDGRPTAIASIENGNMLHIHGAGEVAVTASQVGNLEYVAAVPVTRTLRIGKAPLRVSIADATRSYGMDNPVFEILCSGFVNMDDVTALASVPVATTEATAESNVGDYAIYVGGGESPNYTFAYRDGTLRIAKASQAITLEAPSEANRDAGSIQLEAPASSGLPVTLSVDDTQVATIEGSILHIHRLGTVRVTATQAGDGNYEAAQAVTVTVRVVDPTASFPVRVHQAVSPNGDGINEFLMIEGIRDYPENRVTVFNRNGTIVYEAEGYDNDRVAFRGIGAGQQRVPVGTYFYVVEVRVDGRVEYHKGYLVVRY